jgi:hypothetical protein
MGLLLFLLINWLVLTTLFTVVKKPSQLKLLAESWIKKPFQNLFLLAWLSAILTAGWEILSGGRMSWPITTPWGLVESWKIGGIASFIGLIILFVYSAYENHQHRKRYEKLPKQTES